MVNDGDERQTPFTRPGFIAAMVVITVIVALATVLAVLNAPRDAAPAAATGTTPPAPTGPAAVTTTTPPQLEGDPSVCGLPGEVMEGTLSTPPAAEWKFEGTTAYPTSQEFGPARSIDGVRSCFQHSPQGAVFAAANAVAQGSNQETVGAWLEHFLAEGPHRDAVLSQGPGGKVDDQGIRIEIAGFRLLAYDGETARVDVAVRSKMEGRTVNLSMVYTLTWQDGDWKLQVADPNAPFDVAHVPDIVGYTTWGA